MKRKPVINPFLLFFLLFGASFAALAQSTPPAASVTVKVEVPEGLRSAPYNVDRFATVPPNFKLEVYARLSGARFMAVAPNGDLFVSKPDNGYVKIFRPAANGGQPQEFDYIKGLQKPHDIVFHKVGNTQYVYISEKNQINRFVYNDGDLQAHDREVVVANLPDESLSELQGNYGHVLKNIALDSNDKLYVSIASTCNACIEDTQSNPKRGAIYVYNADGTNGRLFAEGLRNAEGLAFLPGTNELWAAVNNRDQIAYPFNDGSGNYGKVIQSYVDNNPPEEFTLVRDGGNYGWPFCNPDPREGLNDMPFVNDYQLNQNGAVDCSGMDRITKGIAAHSAPLGLIFTQGTNMPAPYAKGALIALHGSWNRSKATGYKVIYFPWQNGRPGQQVDLVSGFLNSDSTQAYARPVDVAVAPDGSLYISDDASHTIFKLTYSGPLGAKQEELARAIQVYPVPSKNTLKLKIAGANAKSVKLVLTNAQSANVLEATRSLKNGENNLLLDTSSLANGIYFLSIIANDTRVVKRVVIQN